MERDRGPLDEPDAEELRAAAALGEALEGRARSTDLPQQALETAALLRFSGPHGELAAERRAEIRASLLASLPARAPQRRRWASLALWIPAALGASLAVVFASRALFQDEAPSPSAASRAESDEPFPAAAAAPERLAKAKGAARAPAASAPVEAQGRAQAMELAPDELARLSEATRSFRTARITPLVDAPLARLHARIEASSSVAELERAAQSVSSRLGSSEPSIGSAAPGARGADLVQQDLFCRLAEAALRVGQPQQALEWAQRGLDLDGPPNPLLAQLTAIDGQARASLGDRTGAARSYLRALEINETLLDQHLDGR